jgi:hypothetical protein
MESAMERRRLAASKPPVFYAKAKALRGLKWD